MEEEEMVVIVPRRAEGQVVPTQPHRVGWQLLSSLEWPPRELPGWLTRGRRRENRTRTRTWKRRKRRERVGESLVSKAGAGARELARKVEGEAAVVDVTAGREEELPSRKGRRRRPLPAPPTAPT
jgi:hypothetical protein